MSDNSGRIRPGRPGFTLYFDQVDAIMRLAKRNVGQGLAFFSALAEYARDGSLPDDPFIDLALSGHMHQIETDCERYWKIIDGGQKGGKNSAEKRKAQMEQAAATGDPVAITAVSQEQPAAQQEQPFTFIKTQDGMKPIYLSKMQQFERLLTDEYDLENAILAYVDDVQHGSEPTPDGTLTLIMVGFREWAKGRGLLKHT